MNKIVLILSFIYTITCTIAYFFYPEMEQHKECGQFAIVSAFIFVGLLAYNKKMFGKWMV